MDLFNFSTAIKQRRLREAGYCSLCGITKADTAVGNRQLCTPCKTKFGTSPAPAVATVMAAERAAVAAYEQKFGEIK